MANESRTKRDELRTTMNISLSVDDKKYLKVYAIEHDTTVAALIHDAVNNLRQEEKKDGRK